MMCSICQSEFGGYGNNPYPLKGEPCCKKYNQELVIPLRISSMDQSRIITLEPTSEIHFNDYKTKVDLHELHRLISSHIKLSYWI